ncbi:MAG: heparinase II/III family protein [Actinobacteria bacterium]|nr:heparinase II/III family protein [Actinomycetota bacterium]
MDGAISLLNEHRELGWPPVRAPEDASQLWRYHLHYLEWAWSLLRDSGETGKRFGQLWLSWRQANRFGGGEAWSPYVASVRAWVLCHLYGELADNSELKRDLVEDLRLHAGFIRTHLELDVGGNHLMKNLKALVGLGIFFDDKLLLRAALRLLHVELDRQVLPDGGHFELSPSYHVQVLGDLTDIAGLLNAYRGTCPSTLSDAIRRMKDWMVAMLLPDGDVPLFNDCVSVPRRLVDVLTGGARPSELFRLLSDSGYFVARMGPFHLVGDIGSPCPDELPAHAHADCLSFVLTVDGQRVIVDTGTSTYEGDRRHYERSTRAHNTAEVGGENQTEVWGRFRAARRARPKVEEVFSRCGRSAVQAAHDGYLRLPERALHRRRWDLRDDALTILDTVAAKGTVPVAFYLHIEPGIEPKKVDAKTVVADPVRMRFDSRHPFKLEIIDAGQGEEGWVATDFNRLHPSFAVVARTEVSGSLDLATTVERL